MGGKPERKRPVEMSGHRFEDNIDRGWEGVNWMVLAQGREQVVGFLKAAMNLLFP